MSVPAGQPTDTAALPAAEPALTVRGLDFSYGPRPALQQVDFSVPAGGFVILLGPNGAGKTTLFSLITRLYDRRVGDIRIGGHDVRTQSVQALDRIGVVFQQPTLDLDLTVRQNLSYHAALHGIGRREARGLAEEQMARMGVGEHAHARVRQLSGGQRRRVEIARALLHRPALLLLDEPTVGLDMASRRALVRHVHALSADDGVAVLWATHLIDEVREGDRVIVLHQGRIRADGPVAEITAGTGTGSLEDAYDALTAEGGGE